MLILWMVTQVEPMADHTLYACPLAQPGDAHVLFTLRLPS